MTDVPHPRIPICGGADADFVADVQMKKILLAVAALSCSVGFAQSSPGGTRGGWSYLAMGDGSYRVIAGSNAIGAIPAMSVAPAGAPAVFGASGIRPSGGQLAMVAKQTLPVGLSNPLVVDVEAKVVKSSLGAALGRFLGKTVPVVSTGIALYELAKELGFDVEVGTDNLYKFKKTVPGEPTMVHMFWTGQNRQTLQLNANSSCGIAATLAAAGSAAYVASYSGTAPGSDGSPGVCSSVIKRDEYYAGPPAVTITTIISSGFVGYIEGTDQPAAGIPIKVPATPAEFQQAVVDFPVPDTDTAMPKLLGQLLDSGETVATETPTVTGPATVPGPSKVTQNPDGTTSTTGTTQNITYNGDKVSTSIVTNTSNYNPTTNTTTNTSTTTTNPEKTPGLCDLFPDIVACAKLGDSTAPEFGNTDSGFSQIESVLFASSPSCPSPIPISFLGRTVMISYDPACAALNDYVKPVILVLAAGFAAFIFVGGFKS